jgi:hypothetical protein
MSRVDPQHDCNPIEMTFRRAILLRLGQPALVGEPISGVLLGTLVRSWPAFFPILSGLEHNVLAGRSPTPPIVESLFSAVVIVAVATTLLVPVGLRFVMPLPPEMSLP